MKVCITGTDENLKKVGIITFTDMNRGRGDERFVVDIFDSRDEKLYSMEIQQSEIRRLAQVCTEGQSG